MMRSLRIILIALLFCTEADAKGLHKVSATYLFHASPEMSVDQARQTALDRAMTKALADEFGMTVTQATSSAVAVSGEASRSQFISTGGSELRGEWIETLGEPRFDISFADGMLTVECTVSGRAREINPAEPRFAATTLRNGLTQADESTEFYDGDRLYLNFETPADGYLAAYLTDPVGGNAYRLLPYALMANEPLKVDGGCSYTYFHSNSGDSRSTIDELERTCSNMLELNDLCILYCPQEFSLPKAEIPDGYGSPEVSLKDFHRYLAAERTRNPRLQLKTIHLTIKNPAP